jgi:hypothetical protein
MEYAIAKRHPLIGQQLSLPECGELPAVSSPDSENCLKLGIPRPENIEPGRSDVPNFLGVATTPLKLAWYTECQNILF